MFEQERDHFVLSCVVTSVEAEVLEVPVLTNHVGGGIGEFGDDVSQRGFIERVFQVLDNGEIDIAFFEKGDRPSCFASTRVEIQSHVLGAHPCTIRGSHTDLGRFGGTTP